MREIKYRGWINTEERYGGQMMGEVCRINEVTYEIGFYNHGDFSMGDVILMQYTGLKDMNGVEIYEGDILTDEDEQIVGVVEMDDGNTYFNWENISELLSETHNRVTKIGNVYENPELLKE